MNTPFNQDTRAANIGTMAARQVDLLVIGAGITGAGIARDAAMRGIRTALVDQGDFGSGTSGRSSRLVHGGLRYLELYDWRLVFEASRERRNLLNIAPHLVWPRSFLFPVYRGSRVAPWKLAAGLWLYDLLALFRNVRRHRMLSKSAMLRAEPGLKERGLRGGGRYFDAQCDDARLTLANARAAHQHGALVANYVGAERLELADGQVRGARVTDRLTGASHLIRALVTVNATGPWSETLGATRQGAGLRPTKGAHVAVPRERMGNREAIVLISPIDGRVMFIVPWGRLSYIGTTETETSDAPDSQQADANDVIYLLRSANALFPDARLQPADVVSTWAGVRPLLAPTDDRAPGSVSREHRIVESEAGLISIQGGKLTTYRRMAADVVDRVGQRLRSIDGRRLPTSAATDRDPLPGGEVRDLELLVTEVEREGVPPGVANHLVRTYGSEAAAVVHLAAAAPELWEPVAEGHPVLRAELVHAMRREMAVSLTDLLIRRTHLFYEIPGHALDRVAAVAEWAATELKWDQARKAAEVADYVREAERNDSFRTELAKSSESVT